MDKKGQVTLFVIIGIVIVIAIGLGLYFSGMLKEAEEKAELAERALLTQKEKDVALFIDGCVEQTLQLAVAEISRNGGYYPPNEDSTSYLAYEIPLYYDNGMEEIPTVDEIMAALADYVDGHLANCLTGDLEIVEPAKSMVVVGNTLRAEVEMLVQFEESKLHKFYGEIDVDYNDVYNDVIEFYNSVKRFNETMDILELGRQGSDEGYDYVYDSVDNKSLYLLTLDVVFDNESLVFPFAVRKDIPDEIYHQLLEQQAEAEEEELTEEEFLDDEEVPEEVMNFTENLLLKDFNEEDTEDKLDEA